MTMPLASAQVETTLLLLKIGFLVLLYLFIWRIVRSVSRDLRLPQESMIIAPQQAAARGLNTRPMQTQELGRLVVVKSPALPHGEEFALDAAPVSIGRASNNDLSIDGDEYASARHARFEPRRDGVYIEDVGSTNGTFVNGIRVTRERRLTRGDVVRVGETDLRFES
jgi:pSer/pThr/pTyr-binding forkhead associated (FHA) protein